MSIDTGRERIDGGRPRRRPTVRLAPAAKPGQAGELPARSLSEESAERSKPRERNGSNVPKEDAMEGARHLSLLSTWAHRLRCYGLALLLVGVAAVLRWALSDLLSPVPFLIFYLALVGAVAFGGLGPGLLATLASWLCIDFLFDPIPGHIGLHDSMSIARLLVFLGSGLAISVAGERLRRSRIRARRQTEELAAANAALGTSEEKYRFLVENSKDITWRIDVQGRWTFVSGNVEKATGYRADEVIGKTIWDFLAPECHDLVREMLHRRLHGEDLPPYEVLIVGKDGRHMPFELDAVAIVDDGGNVVGVQGVSRDITERKRAEAALRESEYHLAQAQQITHLGSWSWDLAEDRLFWSDETYRLYGLQPGESAPRHEDFLGFVHPDDRPRVQQCVQEALAHGGSSRLDFRLVPQGGQERYVHCEAQVILDREGHPVKAEGALQDITERKRVEEALLASQSMLQSVMANVPQGIFWKDRHSRYLGCNPVFAKAVGLESPGDIVGKTDYDLPWLPEQTASFRKYDRRIMANDAPEYHIIEPMQDADGRLLWVETNKVPLHDAQGHVIGVLGTYEDITERQRAAEALRASEEKYRFLVENSRDITYLIDLQSKWMFISSNIEKVTGYRADELIGQTIWGLLAPECHDLARENMRRRARGEDLPPYEVVAVGKDGRRTPFEVYAGSIIDDGGNVVGVQGVARDITERKRAEQDLRESRNKYQALIETTADFIWEMDASGKYTYCSPQMKDLWGYEPRDMIGKTPFDVMPPDDRKQAIESFMSLAKAPQPFTGLEASSYDSQGRLIAVEISGVPFFDADGRLLGYRGISRDVTERKRAQEALAESRKKYRGLVEKVNDWVWEINAAGVYTYVSPRAQELLGYAPEEIVGKTPFDFMPPAEAQRVWNVFEPTWLERKPLELFENTLVRKDGRVVTVETSGMPVFAEDGTFLGYTGIDRDVTERKQAEEALRESEEKFRLLAETSPAAILIYQEGKYVYVNPAAESLTGYRRDELLPQAVGDVVHPDYRRQVKQMISRRAQGQEPPVHYEVKILTKDGQERWMDSVTGSIRYGNRPAGLVVAFDITERKWAEEALRKSEEKFATAFRSSPIAIAVTRLRDGCILDANEAMLKLLHFTADEVIGHTTRDLDIWVDVSDRAQFTQMLSTAGSVRDLEYRLRTKDGAVVMIHLSAELLEFGGEPCMLSTLVDVTERERAAEALRREKAFTDKLLNAPRDTVFLFEPATGQPIRWNQRFAEVSGYDDEEIAGLKVPDDFLDEHDLDKARESIVKVRAEGQGVVELFLVTKRGVHIPFEYATTVVETEDGKTLFLAIGRDITERKRAEEVLRRSEEQFHRLFEDDLTADFITTPEGEILLCNPAFARTFGFSRAEDAVGTSIMDLYLDPQERRLLLERLKKEGKIERLEVWRKRRDGEPIYIVENVVGQFDEQGRLYEIKGYLFEDTQRKRAEDALRELTATLESKVARRTEELEYRAGQLQKLTLELTEAEERERKRLAEILHDDLQQVLAAAKFHVGLLGSRVKDDAESQEIAGQARDLLGDAIAKSRSLSHELSAPGLSRSDLIEAFEWLAEQMQTKHRFTVHLEVGEQIEVASEPLRVLLYKAAQELLFNAIKHAGVHEATLRLRHRRGRIWLFVSDQGRGFDSRGLGKASGFGLLSIRERVEYLGGRMKIRSAPGKGSIFAVAVPDADAREPAGPQEVSSAPGGAPATKE
jgi:PAS domain S-box-containing protein